MSARLKEFKAPTDQEVKVWSDDFSGCTIIGTDWTPVREDQWKAAYSEGCISKDMAVKGFNQEQTLAVLKHEEKVFEQKMMEEMKKLIEEGDPEKLDAAGRPKIPVLGDILGRIPTAKKRNEIYNKLMST